MPADALDKPVEAVDELIKQKTENEQVFNKVDFKDKAK